MKNYPFKLNRPLEYLTLAIVVVCLLAGIVFYQHLPLLVISHWNIQGQPNGYSSREFGAFGLPAIMLIAYFLFLFLPIIDPHRNRYAEFGKAYHLIKFAIIALLGFLYFVMSFANLGYPVAVEKIVPIALGILYIVIGISLSGIKKNFFFGIRTPWTLSSENVWNKTHKLGGTLFTVAGILIILSCLLTPLISFIVLIGATILAAIISVLYSYALYRKEHN